MSNREKKPASGLPPPLPLINTCFMEETPLPVVRETGSLHCCNSLAIICLLIHVFDFQVETGFGPLKHTVAHISPPKQSKFLVRSGTFFCDSPRKY